MTFPLGQSEGRKVATGRYELSDDSANYFVCPPKWQSPGNKVVCNIGRQQQPGRCSFARVASRLETRHYGGYGLQ